MLNTLIVKKTNMYTSHALIYTNASVSKTFLLSPIQTNISLFKRFMWKITPMLAENPQIIKEVSNTALNVLNIITNETIINELKKKYPKALLEKTLEYMHSNKDSSVQ